MTSRYIYGVAIQRRMDYLYVPVIIYAFLLQSFGLHWYDCSSDSPDRIIRGCSTIIERNADRDMDLAMAYFLRGHGYSVKGDYPTAIADLDKAIGIDPKNVDALIDRGVAHRRMNELDKTIADYDSAIAINPRHAMAYNNRCWTRVVHDLDLEMAKSDCEMALRLAPNEALFLDSRGLLNLKLKQFAEAWKDYDAAVRAAPDEAVYLYGRGIASLSLGKTKEGKDDIANALKVNPAVAKEFASYGIEEITAEQDL